MVLSFGLPPLEESDDDAKEETEADAESRSSPGRADRADRPQRYTRVPTTEPPGPADPALSLSDSFILEQLRGWRLLTSANLSSEEWRDVLGTTQGKLDYQSISDALQVLYDEQMTGASRQHFQHPLHGQAQVFHMEQDTIEDDAWTWDDGWGDWQDDWQQVLYAGQEDDWWAGADKKPQCQRQILVCFEKSQRWNRCLRTHEPGCKHRETQLL